MRAASVPIFLQKLVSEINKNEKKLLFINIQGQNLKRSSELQDANIKTLSDFIYKVFNQIKIIDSSKDEHDNFIPSYLR